MFSLMCFYLVQLGEVIYEPVGESGGRLLGSSSADHVTSATGETLMRCGFVRLETVRQRSKQGAPLPPTDSLYPFLVSNSSKSLTVSTN